MRATHVSIRTRLRSAYRAGAIIFLTALFVSVSLLTISNWLVSAQNPAQQVAVVAESFGYLNFADLGGPPPGGVDGDGAPPLQTASMTATFSNFALNGISYVDWTACRTTQTVDQCLATLGPTLRQQHPGAIGGDTFTFDVTITNTSASGGPVLTNFAFQSKFSESPALGSRIGDKLFAAERVGPVSSTAANPLIGVKKNGVTNGLFRDGKVKGICINSSDDYPTALNLGTENETLECFGGRTFDLSTDKPVLQAADGSFIGVNNIKLPKGLLPGETMTLKLLLDAGTDDGALQRAWGGTMENGSVGPLIGTLANVGQPRPPHLATECLELNVQPGDNVLQVVNSGDVKIIRDSAGNCAPSFNPFSKNQFLTVPRRNWGFTDILDTRDDFNTIEHPLPGQSGKFSFLDFGNLKSGEMNFFEILRGFGEFGANLDPSCQPGGSREGRCGLEPYVPWAEFYGITSGKLVRQEVVGSYGPASYAGGPSLTASINTGAQTDCAPTRPIKCKTTDTLEIPGQPNPGSAIGASAMATFSDVVVISDDKNTIPNEGGQAGGDRVRFTMTITNTSPPGSNIYLTSFNFQTKQRGLTDINELDGTSIQGRQDLRTGANGTLPVCGSDPLEAKCFDPALGIGRFPNVLGNSLLSSVFAAPDPADPLYGSPDQAVAGKLESIKKNGTFEPLTKLDSGAANSICIKSGPQTPDLDADETCAGEAGKGLLPGETQTVRLEMDYGDFRGLILRVSPGTMVNYSPMDPHFGLLALRGDFDCRDQRQLPYCHPDLVGQDWFTMPTSLGDTEFVTVHQPGDAASVMNFTQNFGKLLAMAGFIPTAEFYQGATQLQVKGAYQNQVGGPVPILNVSIISPIEASLVSGTTQIIAHPIGSVAINQVEFFVNGNSIGTDTNGADGWSFPWNTTTVTDGVYQLTVVASGGGLNATSPIRTVTVGNALGVKIIQPATNSTLTGTTTLIAQTTGLNAATGVTFSYNPLPSGPATTIGAAIQTTPGHWEIAWNTTGVTPGNYSLKATATNGIETVTHTITVEVVILKVTIIEPDDGGVLFGTVHLKAEVVSATPVTSVEFFYDATGFPVGGVPDTPKISLGTATFDSDSGLWVLSWNTRTVADTPLTKPRTQDELSVVAIAGPNQASDEIDMRVSNMLTARIFLPDNQEDLLGYEDLEALIASEFDITSVRFDLYNISDIDPQILIPFGEASVNGERIVDFKYGRPLGNPVWPMNTPSFPIGAASLEGASRWVIRNWDTKTVPDGTYGLVATAFDSAGRKATYMVEAYVVNDLKITITAPNNGASVTGFVALEARTSGLFPATGVVFNVVGANITATETSPGRWKAVWNSNSSPTGPYTVTATATNIAAETATDSVNITRTASATLNPFFPFDWTNCNLMQCSFLDGSTGGPSSWLWNFGDGVTSTAQNPNHTYANPGVYTVTLTVNGSLTYTRKIPVGNIGIDGFNTNPVNDAGTQFITWTSAFKDFAYNVGDTIYVPAMWKTTVGSARFDSLPTVFLFSPEEAEGEVNLTPIPADDGVLFSLKFTKVQYRGVTPIFKGKVHLGLEVDVDYENDNITDWDARLGTNVDVTNTALATPNDFLNVWVVAPDEGAQVSGVVQVRAAPETSVTVSKIEFFANGSKIGEDTDGSNGWTVSWNTTGLASGNYQLTAVATGGGLTATSTGVTVTVNSGTCTFSVNPTAQNFMAPGGTGSVTVTVGAGCAWTAESNVGWITNTNSTSGNGSGSFNFSVSAYTGPERSGTLTIAGQTITITQLGAINGNLTGLQFYPLPKPIRLLDTRPGEVGCDAPGAAIAGGTSRTQTAAGRTCNGLTIPANARALTGNITTVQSGGGYLTLYPSDAQRPLVANSNYSPNEILNNVFTVGLGAGDGAFKIFALSQTHVVVDVTGYYAPPATGGLYFHPLPKPIRLLETRAGQPGCIAPGAMLPGGSNTTQTGQISCGGVTIPAGARALVGNATTVNPQGGGYLTFYPADASQPLVASSNFTTGQIMNAPFTVGLSPGGSFKIFTTTTTNLVIDVLGYYSAEVTDVNGVGLLFNSLPSPIRLLETRLGQPGCYTPGTAMIGGANYLQQSQGACTNIPAAAKAVVGNATVVNSTAGYLTFWPSNTQKPLVSTSNYLTGQIFNRHFTVGLGPDGAFRRFALAPTDLVIDLSGYFAP